MKPIEENGCKRRRDEVIATLRVNFRLVVFHCSYFRMYRGINLPHWYDKLSNIRGRYLCYISNDQFERNKCVFLPSCPFSKYGLSSREIISQDSKSKYIK